MKRILLVGATGVFGSRLAAMIATIADVELILAARNVEALDRLKTALEAQGARADISIRTVDRRQPRELSEIQPWLTVDASGPFQEEGYDFARAVIDSGSHYVDLADARDFVARFPQELAAAANAHSVLAVTGASSTPALSHAALDALTSGWQNIDKIVVVISPGARAPRGLAVLRSILSYAGKPVRLFQRGAWRTMPGWSGLRRIDMPGLGSRWASLCETPDLDLLPQRYHARQDAYFLAGLELSLMHLGLAALCMLVRWRFVPSLVHLAHPLRTIAGWLAPFGTDRGGMIVEAEGTDACGNRIRARWALWADAGAGPHTPAAPAAALVRALLADAEPRRGAHVSAGMLGLDAILGELKDLPIHTRVDESYPAAKSLFRRLLGRRFDALPACVRAIHDGEQTNLFTGWARARVGKGVIARILRQILGLPASGRTDAEVQIAVEPDAETWTRRFGSARFSSRLSTLSRLSIFEEQFGPLYFAFALKPTSRGVIWTRVGWRLWRLPLPNWLGPNIHARADGAGGTYRFRVAVGHPWTGLLFAYRGELTKTSDRD